MGGLAGVQRVVDRFYDVMDEPDYRPLRNLHAPDLDPMRESLAGFLTGWLGGPRDWFERNPGKCMMSLHAPIPIDAITTDLWISAMDRAMFDSGVDPFLTKEIGVAFRRMATAMVNR
jgi:hemoglobin